VWEGAEFPARALGFRQWVDWFREVGFIDTTDDTGRLPTSPVRAWRGSPWGQRRGMSWTVDRERATWFADRSAERFGRPAHVFEVEIPPAAILVLNLGVEGRKEMEVIVDPFRLPKLGRSSIVR
jgi:hypothetical protein